MGLLSGGFFCQGVFDLELNIGTSRFKNVFNEIIFENMDFEN